MASFPLHIHGVTSRWVASAAVWAVAWGGLTATAQVLPIEAAVEGRLEAGVPPFVVFGPESLGLGSAPLDLHRLPDGRMLALGRRELAMGDGVRWEVFRQADDDVPVEWRSLVVADDGAIYGGVAGGFGRVEFGADGRWRMVKQAGLPAGTGLEQGIPTMVEQVADQWVWSWGSGPVMSWRPGQEPRLLGMVNSVERVFSIGGRVHLSDSSNGKLYRLEARELVEVAQPPGTFIGETVTAAVVRGAGGDLLGTVRHGVRVHEGGVGRALEDRGLLAGDYRINDLCATEGGLLAAALDNLGIVFFERDGKAVQVLDRSVDHRLARVRRLLRGPGGAVWALLSDGVARVGFPSRLSHFEPMVATGLVFAQPYRFRGDLWLMSDGRAQRGVYDREGRLTRFEVRSPEAHVSCLQELGGRWLAGAQDGIHEYTNEGGWRQVVAGIDSPYFRPEPVGSGRWLYVAQDEVGWLRLSEGGWEVERFPMPGMGHVYGVTLDAGGALWGELGAGGIVRVQPTLPRPTVRRYDGRDGWPSGWPQLFTIDGVARVNLPGAMLRYEAGADRFIPDRELVARYPIFLDWVQGRPVPDANGRLWVTNRGRAQAIGPDGVVVEAMPEGLKPLHFTPQPDGVMWLHERGRLARYDPRMPVPAPVRLRAMITRVEFPVSNRTVFVTGAQLGDVPAADNFVVAHFVVPDSPPGQPVTCEVRLEGAEGGWVSAGSIGSAAFNHLPDGDYRLRVRPRLGAQTGEEATLSFRVLAPWYRTTSALAGYAAAGAGLLALVAWLTSYIVRRDKQRLQRVVAERTAELNASNRELGRKIDESVERAEALKVSEDRYRRLSENAPDIIFRVRVVPEVAYDYINQAVARITSYRPGEFYADATLVRKIGVPPVGDTLYEIATARVVPAGVREIRWRARSGRVVTLEERLTPIFDRDGQLVAIEGIARDITDRKLAEEAIHTLSQAIEQSPVGVFITDLKGGVVFANPRMSEQTGCSNGELLAQNLFAGESELVPAEAVGGIKEALLRGARWTGQLATRHKDGRVVHVRASFSAMRGPDGALRHFLALREDVTQWVEDQERQQRLESQLFQSQKLESLGTLAGGIAHDFNNILTGILGYTELLTLAGPEGEPVGEELREIRAAGLRAKDLVAQILTFSRRGESRLVPVDLARIVAEAMKLVRASTPAMIEIVRDLPPSVVRGDATQLHQVVLNLCTNAIYAMKGQSGRLTVALARVTVDLALAGEVADLEPGAHVRLTVSDTGRGMDAGTMARIFDPFFTTKAQGEGTGLGLAIVQGIVANHGGAMRVHSREGAGATFELYFREAQGGEEEAPVRAAPPRGGRREILIVDDEVTVARFVAARLQQYDYRVTVFHDPRQAVAAFAAAPERYQAVVTDLMMPHLSGLELIEQIRSGRAVVPVVITSGLVKELARVTAETLPRSAVLAKPFSGAELAQTLGQLLAAKARPA